jgi:hypothetical protein
MSAFFHLSSIIKKLDNTKIGDFMKTILKTSAFAILLSLGSCAHHGGHGCCGDKKQCEMKEGKKSCPQGEQCDMKKDAPKTEEVKK